MLRAPGAGARPSSGCASRRACGAAGALGASSRSARRPGGSWPRAPCRRPSGAARGWASPPRRSSASGGPWPSRRAFGGRVHAAPPAWPLALARRATPA
eukprot:7785775-Lingulodinium_polyedra.AAC.1